MPTGATYRFTQNADGTTFTPPPGSHDSLIRNANGTFDLTLALSRTRYHFGVDGSVLSLTDEYGNALTFSYDGNNRLIQLADGTGSGRSLIIFYGADGRVSSIVDHTGRNVQYTYSGQGNLTSVIDPVSRTTTYSYTNGRYVPLLSQITDNWGRIITEITYDPADRVKTFTEDGETYSYVYNSSTTTTKTDSSGKSRVFTFNSHGQITQIVPPAGAGGGTTTKTFNADGSLDIETDGVGVKTKYTYNSNGSIATITKDYQGTGTGSVPIRFDYSYDFNFPEKVISIVAKNPSTGVRNPDWQEWRYDYYAPGSTAPGALFHVYRIRSDGSTIDTLSTYTYNAAGQLITVTDAAGAITTFEYNPGTDDLVSVTYPPNSDFGPTRKYQYVRDSLGRTISITSPLGNVTAYSYDAVDRISTVTLPKPSLGSPLIFTTAYSYDNFDSSSGLTFTQQTDPNGKIVRLGSDQFGQLGESLDSLNNATTLSYSKGLLSSVTDANENVTSYTYNALRQLVTMTLPEGSSETYTYYLDGLLKTRKDRNAHTTTYTYDHLKRITKRSFGTSVTYTFTGQKLTQVVDTLPNIHETHTFSYDSAFRVTGNTQATRGTITYTYDMADRVSSYTVSGGGPTATYGYYPDGSVKTIDWSPIAGQFRYDYTLDGQYSTVSSPNGQQRNYTYDDQGRLLQTKNTHIAAGELASYNYGYDVDNSTGISTMLGQRTQMTAYVPSQNLINTSTKYYYDSNYQLNRSDYPNVAPFNSEIDTWSYDSIGNRTGSSLNGSPTTYTYFRNGSNLNNGQRLQFDGANTYTYDANGNTTSKNGPSGNFTFTWDVLDRMTAISGATAATYVYDYLGRRVSKKIGSVTTTYLYAGANLIAERGGATADFLFGPSIDEPLSMKRGTTISYYIPDGLGSIGLLTDANGTLQNSYVYDAWGVVRSQSAGTTNSFTYTAREASEAGLIYNRARYMSPNIGKFVSQDAFGFYAGVNFYGYALNNPTKYYDPMGHLTIALDLLPLLPVAARSASLGIAAESASLGPLGIAAAAAAIPVGYLIAKGLDQVNVLTPADHAPVPHNHFLNPYGCRGKPDHQEKVDDLVEIAGEQNPDYEIIRERQIRHPGSRRIPDVQVVDPTTGEVVKIYEAERTPRSSRVKNKEIEYDTLEIPYEIFPLDQP